MTVTAVHLAALVAAFAGGAGPEPIELGDGAATRSVGEALWILQDPDAALNIADVSAPERAVAFERSRGQRPNLGYTRAAIWLRFSLENRTDHAATWVLDVGREWLEEVDLYREWAGGFSRQRSGARVPLADRAVATERPAFEIPLGPRERATFYLRLRSAGPVSLFGALVPRARFEQDMVRTELAFGGFYAVLLVMAAFHLLLSMVLRDAGLAALAGFLVSYTGAEMSAHGHVARFFPALAAVAEIRLMPACFALAALALVAFARDVLATRELSRGVDRALRAAAIVGAGGCFAAAAVPAVHALAFVGLAGTGAVVLWSALVRWRSGFRTAMWFALAIAAFLAPGLVAISAIMGLAPVDPLTEHANHVGVVAMTCLLSGGLAGRIRSPRGLDARPHATTADETAADPPPPMTVTAMLAELCRVDSATPPGPSPFVPGAVVGRFELLRELGRGGFGIVFEARDRVLRRRVAFKAICPGEHPLATTIPSLRLEAEAAARLMHPNIVTIHDFGVAMGEPYLIMELLDGETLARRLRRGRPAAASAVSIALEVARGLEHAHAQGVLHRDLTPANVFVCTDGRVKVLDFGLAHLFGARTRAPGGTPGYAAPEQWEGARDSPRSDVFGAAAMLYEMLTGEPPSQALPGARVSAASLGSLQAASVAPPLAELVRRGLAIDPTDRPPDGYAWRLALETVARGLDATPAEPHTGADAHRSRWRRRRSRRAPG